MSEENVEIVRRTCDAFNEGGVDAALAFLHPDLVWEDRVELPGASVFRGHEGFRQATDRFYEAWDDLQVEAADITEAGEDRVLVEHRWRGRGKEGGTPIDTVVWNVLTLEDGLIVRRQAFGERAMALEAAGLPG